MQSSVISYVGPLVSSAVGSVVTCWAACRCSGLVMCWLGGRVPAVLVKLAGFTWALKDWKTILPIVLNLQTVCGTVFEEAFILQQVLLLLLLMFSYVRLLLLLFSRVTPFWSLTIWKSHHFKVRIISKFSILKSHLFEVTPFRSSYTNRTVLRVVKKEVEFEFHPCNT